MQKLFLEPLGYQPVLCLQRSVGRNEVWLRQDKDSQDQGNFSDSASSGAPVLDGFGQLSSARTLSY